MKLKLPPNYKSVLMAPDGRFLATKYPQDHYDNQGWDFGTSYFIYGDSREKNDDFTFYYAGRKQGGNARSWELLFNSNLEDINIFTTEAAGLITLHKHDVSLLKKMKKLSPKSIYLHGEDGKVWLLSKHDTILSRRQGERIVNCYGDRWRFECELKGIAIKPSSTRVLLKCLPAIWEDDFQVRINHSGLLEFNSAKYNQTLYIKAFRNTKSYSTEIEGKPALANFRIN